MYFLIFHQFSIFFFFWSLTNLEWISLSTNCLKTIESELFEGLSNLTSIDLSSNNIDFIDFKNTFKRLTKLKSLYLQNNKLVKIDKLPQLPSLMFLWLDDNNITTINKEAFRNCFLLTDIRLDHNQIEDIDKETFKDLSDLASIYLHNNKFKQQQDDEKRLELYFEKKLNFISLNNNNDENCIHLLKKVLV